MVMLTIEIKANNKLITKHKVVNVTERLGLGIYGQGIQTYEIDGNILVKHQFEDGAEELARLVLNRLHKSRQYKTIATSTANSKIR